jgi:8-oxo-dGTP pyrophosphatase MutT (NUDIX family)
MFKRLALVTSDFQAKVARLVNKLIYTTPAFKAGKKHLSIVGVFDPEDPEDTGYYFSQRLGINSVAFVLYDADNPDAPYIVLEQYHSPIRQFVKGAFTGSLDKPELDPADTLIEEVQEEAGYTVDKTHIHCIAFLPVSANTNERVHLCLVDVTGLQAHKQTPENIFEQNTNMYRLSFDQVIQQCEWKAQILVLHHLRDLLRSS